MKLHILMENTKTLIFNNNTLINLQANNQSYNQS